MRAVRCDSWLVRSVDAIDGGGRYQVVIRRMSRINTRSNAYLFVIQDEIRVWVEEGVSIAAIDGSPFA